MWVILTQHHGCCRASKLLKAMMWWTQGGRGHRWNVVIYFWFKGNFIIWQTLQAAVAEETTDLENDWTVTKEVRYHLFSNGGPQLKTWSKEPDLKYMLHEILLRWTSLCDPGSGAMVPWKERPWTTYWVLSLALLCRWRAVSLQNKHKHLYSDAGSDHHSCSCSTVSSPATCSLQRADNHSL